MDLDELTIGDGALSAGLVPGIGGSLSYFRWRGLDLTRPLSDEARARRDVLGVAMFPMMPYANRIAGNEFAFAGRTWQVQANNPPETFNVHGSAWQRAWKVAEADAATARLVLDVAGEWDPFSYHAEQRFALREEVLHVSLTLQNRGNHALPFGFGLHPWFERSDDVTLRFSAKRFHLEEPDNVAGEPISLPPELDFSAGRPLPSRWRNNNYGGWNGAAEIRFRQRGVGLRIDADAKFRNLMFYADPAKPYFCLEPQTNASGALNRGLWGDPEEGVAVLSPGEKLQGSVRFTPFETDAGG